MFKILRVLGRIIDVIAADGSERLKLAITNVIFMALAVACAWGIYELSGMITDIATNTTGGCSCDDAGSIVGYAFAIFICGGVGLYALIAGALSQAVLVLFALLGCIFSDERGANAIALLIAIISLGGAAVGGLYLFGII